MAEQENTPKQLFDLLVSKNFNPKALNTQGKATMDPSEADMFSFNFVTTEKDYGTVVVLLDSENNLEVYYGNNIVNAMSGKDRNSWYDFLYQLRMFAKSNTKQFGLNNLNRLKYRMQSMSTIQESLFEGYYGTKKTSYQDQPQKTRLIIKHSKKLGDEDARYRNISSLFVENGEGERFKLPFNNLSAGRAMSRHVAEGGNPYDPFGQHISEMVSQIKLLSGFTRANRNRELTEDAQNLYQLAEQFKNRLQKRVKRMASRRGYHKYIEGWQPSNIEPQEEVVEAVREMFAVPRVDQRIENAAPVLAKLKQEEEMRELNEFEEWTQQVTEGTWEVPESRRQQEELRQMFKDEITVGPDAINATERLYNLVGDDKLYDSLADLARVSPDADARPLIQDRLKEFGIQISGVTDIKVDNIDEEHDLDTGEVITSDRDKEDKKNYLEPKSDPELDEDVSNPDDTGLDDLKRLLGIQK